MSGADERLDASADDAPAPTDDEVERGAAADGDAADSDDPVAENDAAEGDEPLADDEQPAVVPQARGDDEAFTEPHAHEGDEPAGNEDEPVGNETVSDALAAAGAAPRRSFFTERPVAVLMVALATVVFGFFSYSRLPVTLMPELSYPTLTVRTEYPGAAPEEVENDVSRPIEDALGVVGGLTRISSVSRAGLSDVVLEFSWDTEMADAIQDTLEKLDLVFLPDDTERPLILRFDPSLDPVVELSLSGSGAAFEGEDGLRRLRRLAELQVKRALEPVKGVAAVRVRGGLEEEIQVLIDEEELRRRELSIRRVIDRLDQENINVAGGTIQEGRTEYLVRTLNEYQSLEQIRDTVLARRDDREIRVRDVAEVRMGHKEREIATRTEGAESVQIDIYKEADANMVAMADRVTARIGELDIEKVERELEEAIRGEKKKRGFGPGSQRGPKQDRPLAEDLYLAEGAELRVVADRSIFIESSIREVRQTAMFGGLLAIIVLFLFLRNLKTTAIIAVSIPISLLVTFAPLNLLGVSLNIMSLGGLALGIGMLVDSSIVVLESIFRCREEGDDVKTAAVRGTGEVRGAVIASTLTSIAVFFPMVFVEGVAGQAFGDLGLAVVISLLVSVVVAVTFIPMLASRGGGLDLRQAGTRPRVLTLSTPGFVRRDLAGGHAWWRRGPVVRLLPFIVFLVYLLARTMVQLALEIVGRLIFGFLLLVGGALALLLRLLVPIARRLAHWPLVLVSKALGGAESAYPPLLRWSLRRSGTIALLALLACASVVWLGLQLETELLPEVRQGELTVEVALPVGTPIEETDAVLAPVERAILQEVEGIRRLLVTIGYDASNTQRSDEGEHTARFKVLLDSSDPGQEDAVVERLRRRFAELPDVDARITRPVLFSFRTPIEVEVQGENLVELRRWAERVRSEMATMPELADVETTLRAGAPEMQILYDRDRLAAFDLDIFETAEMVRAAVQGEEATRYNLTDRRIPILVRYQEEDRAAVEDVRRLVINSGEERPISLEAVADVALGEGPSEVRRIDGQRVALVRANLAEGAALGAAVTRIENELATLDWPDGMVFFLTGQNEEWERSRGSLLLALGLSIFLVYVIMAAQFESLLQPLVIMFTIPLAFLGTFLALGLLEISLSIVVFLGMIMLAGIVVNNAIVLVDYANQLRRRGLDLAEAAVEAGSVRLRPILMTTSTTVLGLLPMAVGLGDGAEIRRPMALAVITGLAVSTLLTLVVIPTIYVLIEGLRRRIVGEPVVDREDDPSVPAAVHGGRPALEGAAYRTSEEPAT